ncbi:chromosome partitioning protein, ParB family [Lachnospiraceae bacterium]|nr:chromosome partitioning protein, ParB family [Lachnospiraceae bacterium]
MAKKGGLGNGLDKLIPMGTKVGESAEVRKEETAVNVENEVIMVRLNKLEPDRNQPRKNFSEDELNELAESITSHGIFQPLLVQQKDKYYEIVAGERRWRAAKIAGLKEVPVIVKNFTEQEKVEIQLLENLQREKLNPIEEAEAYQRLLTEFGMKQDELAESIGKNRTTITNTLRLLNLDERVREMIINENISQGHARALLGIKDGDKQYDAACLVFDQQLSVRDTEKLVKNLGKPEKIKKKTPEALTLIYREMEDKIREKIGAKVAIKPKDDKKGKIEIEYFSQDELENIVNTIKGIQ